MGEIFEPVALKTVETWVQGNAWDALIKFLENPLNLAISFAGTAAIIAAVGAAWSSIVGSSRAHGTARTR